MKNNSIVRFLAWALLALICLSSVSIVSAASNIVFTLAPEAMKRTAFRAGASNRPVSALFAANHGDTPGSISDMNFEAYGVDWLVLEINGNYYGGVQSSEDSRQWYMNPAFTLNPGQSLKISVLAGIKHNWNIASADLVGFGGNFGAGDFPKRDSAIHSVVDELPDEGTGNSSVRAFITSPTSVIKGFEVRGDPHSSYPYLIRAIGPTLAQLRVDNPLADPVVKVYDAKGNLVAENDDWQPQDAEAFRRAGAFPLPRGSLDSALVLWLTPGAYTIHIKAFSTGTGNVLLEDYPLPAVSEKGY